MMRRPLLWPLLAASALLAPPSSASAKPGGATEKAPSAPTTEVPDGRGEIPAPPCGLHESGPKRMVRGESRRKTKITAKYAIGAIGETITLRATLELDDGTRVGIKPVEFKVDGQVIGTVKTDTKGEATIQYKIPSAFGPKPFSARYAGNSLCEGASDGSTVGTVRAPTAVALTLDKHANVGAPMSVAAELRRTTDGAVIGGREVEVYVGGAKVATAVTDAGGRLEIKHTPTTGADKPLEVKAHFTGDVLHNPITAVASAPLYPPLETVYLRWSEVAGYYGQTVPAGVFVTKGAPIAGAKFADAPVRMWVDDDGDMQSLGAATTNVLGVANVALKLDVKPAVYQLHAHADIPRERYVLDKGYAKLVVLKAPVALSVSGPSAVKLGDVASFTLKAVRTTDNQAVKGLDVCYLSICEKTDAAGEAKLSFKLVAPKGATGAQTLSFTSRADDYHVAGAKGFIIQVMPSVE